jgi:coatomer protein complex subunit epsilon
MYRAYLAQKKFTVVLKEVSDSQGKEFAAIRLLANYLSGDTTTKQRIFSDVEKLATQSHDPDGYVHLIIAAQIAYLEQQYDQALKFLHGVDQNEAAALSVQSFLKLDRADLARKELKKMQEKDEDATLTQLSQAAIHLTVGSGGDKLDEAFYIFHDLAAKYGTTPLLANGQAVALIARAKYDEAEPLLHEALEKDNTNAEALINLMVLSHFQGKGAEVANRYLNQLKDSHPHHPFVQECESKERELDRLIQGFA